MKQLASLQVQLLQLLPSKLSKLVLLLPWSCSGCQCSPAGRNPAAHRTKTLFAAVLHQSPDPKDTGVARGVQHFLPNLGPAILRSFSSLTASRYPILFLKVVKRHTWLALS